MRKNSTLQLWGVSMNEIPSDSNQSLQKVYYEQQLEPEQATISKILSYAESVRGVKTQTGDNILISLN
tara:strand:- start:76 stop:279 length:204 start_codon:yes stop_codon:yes gene_type:complete